MTTTQGCEYIVLKGFNYDLERNGFRYVEVLAGPVTQEVAWGWGAGVPVHWPNAKIRVFDGRPYVRLVDRNGNPALE